MLKVYISVIVTWHITDNYGIYNTRAIYSSRLTIKYREYSEYWHSETFLLSGLKNTIYATIL
jgi:hypothetical protein